jgi:hypothetical protein
MSRKASSQSIEGFPPFEQMFDLRSAFDDAISRAFNSDTGSAGTSSGDGGSSGDTGTGDSGSSGSGQSGSSGTSTDSGSTGDDVKDPEKKKLHEEAAQWRIKHKDAEAQLTELQKQLRSFEDKDKTELDKAVRDRDEFKAALEKANDIIKQQAIKLAFFESGASAQFKNPATALKLLDLGDVKIEDDGTVDKEAVKKKADSLLKAEPYLSQDGSDSGSGNSGNQSSGRPANGRKSDEGLKLEELQKKFPALRR